MDNMNNLIRIKKICDNIEDVVFNNVDISKGPRDFEETMQLIADELFKRYTPDQRPTAYNNKYKQCRIKIGNLGSLRYPQGGYGD